MLELIMAGGPFMMIVLLLGTAAQAANIMLFVKRDRRYVGLALGLTAATFLVGVGGTSAGFYAMSGIFRASLQGNEESAQRLVAQLGTGTGVAHSACAMGSLLAAVNAILCGIGYSFRAR